MWNECIVHEIEHETPELADKCSNLSLMSAVSTEQLIKTTISSNFYRLPAGQKPDFFVEN